MRESLMSIGDLFGKTWKVYWKHFWKLILIGVICFGLTTLAAVFSGLFAGFSALPGITLGSGELAMSSALGCFAVVLILAAIIIGTWGQATLIFAAKESSGKWEVEDIFKKGWSKLLSCLWVSILISLIILACLLIFTVPLVIMLISYLTLSTGSTLPVAMIGLMVIGVLIGIPLAVYFAIKFHFSLYAVICEDKRGTKALSRSKELVKGHWWSVFGRVILLLIIYMILSTILRSWAPVLLSILFTPFSAIYCYVIYEDLKKVKAS